MKPKLVLKSRADLPAHAFAFAVAAPGRARNATRQILGSSPPVGRRGIRAMHSRSAEFARNIYARARAPFQNIQPWTRGGLNE